MKKVPTPTKISKNAIRACLSGESVITRFAPSPTGYLHLGHLVNAIYVWGIARGLGGKVILRMEDHDQTRVRPEYETAILEDLRWLGLIPDIGLDPAKVLIQDQNQNSEVKPSFDSDLTNPSISDSNHLLNQGTLAELRLSSPSLYRQSDADDLYTSIANDLHQQGLLYACDCSRKSLRQRATPLPNGNVPYDGFCTDRGLPIEEGMAWRLRLPETGTVHFNDLLQGLQAQTPQEQCGDVIIKDRNGNWTYQFAVVVDDLRQGVNLIIRGMDILDSTGRQQQIAKLVEMGKGTTLENTHSMGTSNEPKLGVGKPKGIGLNPCYLHHGLLMGPNGVKLSKKHFDKDIHERRLAGEDAEDVLGEAAFMAGLISKIRPIKTDELPGLVIE